MRAIVTTDRASVIMSKGLWRTTIPAANIAVWVSLYRNLRDRNGGRFAEFYTQSVEALEAAAAKLGNVVAEPKTKTGGKK
jgi:hypothetical protein